MLSLRLWRALRRPPTRNPVFRRAFAGPEEPFPWYVGCVQWFAILLFLPIIALAGMIYGIGWSVGIANQLAREREARTFELLSLCPSGPLCMSWAIATGYLYHHRTFRNINTLPNILGRSGFMALVLAGVGAVVTAATNGSLATAATMLALSLSLWGALIADHVQSLAAAALTGIVAAASARNRLNAQFYAFALASGLQVITYVLTFTIGFSIAPRLLALGGVSGLPALLLLIGIRLTVFVGSRELLLTLLWQQANAALTPDPAERRWLLNHQRQSALP